MSIHVDLTNMPALCWLWTYLVSCYLVLGPLISRGYYKRNVKEACREGKVATECLELETFMLWSLSPFTVALWPLRYVAFWLAFGGAAK